MAKRKLKVQMLPNFDGFSRRLKCAREWRGFTQTQLAAKAALPLSSICNFELGNRAPAFCSFRNICFALDIPADYFIGALDSVHRRIPGDLDRKIESLHDHYDIVMGLVDYYYEKDRHDKDL